MRVATAERLPTDGLWGVLTHKLELWSRLNATPLTPSMLVRCEKASVLTSDVYGALQQAQLLLSQRCKS